MSLRRILALLLLAAPLAAQPAQPTQVKDASLLHPPAGARLALVEFADYQCPYCGQVNPLIRAAVDKYRIPWVRHDFVLSQHPWSLDAAVYARWFDLRSKSLGNQYRDLVFQSQSALPDPAALRLFTRKFAKSHALVLPANVDPQSKLATAAIAETDLGRQLGIHHTPTVFLVTSGGRGAPWREVLDINRDLFPMLDQALSDTAASPPAKKPSVK